MEKSNRLWWCFTAVGAGGVGTTITLIASSAPAKTRIVALVVLGGLSFSGAVIGLRWIQQTPRRIGQPVRALFIFSLIWIGMIGLGWYVWPVPTPVVTISPASVTFDSPILHDNYIFKVTSNTSKDVYSIEIKFKLHDSILTFSDFSPEIPASSRKPMIDDSKFADIRGVKCRDANGHPVMLLSIYRLTSHESREISFTRNTLQQATLTGEVSHFSEMAQPRIAEPNKMRETFHPGEHMDCNAAISFLLDTGSLKPDFEIKVEKNAQR